MTPVLRVKQASAMFAEALTRASALSGTVRASRQPVAAFQRSYEGELDPSCGLPGEDVSAAFLHA
jgi:hypothetical protein